jgi:hypothetical protein
MMMRQNPNNQHHQPPARPEKTNKSEERRQKACALRTFYTHRFLSPEVFRISGEKKNRSRRQLSIQIDIFRTVPGQPESVIDTEKISQKMSGDKTRMTRDMREEYQDSIRRFGGQLKDSVDAANDRNTRSRRGGSSGDSGNSRDSSEEGRNA